jgi:hypothetical protein
MQNVSMRAKLTEFELFLLLKSDGNAPPQKVEKIVKKSCCFC